MRKAKQTEEKEIGRVKLSDTQDLVASLVGDERVDIRVSMKGERQWPEGRQAKEYT